MPRPEVPLKVDKSQLLGYSPFLAALGLAMTLGSTAFTLSGALSPPAHYSALYGAALLSSFVDEVGVLGSTSRVVAKRGSLTIVNILTCIKLDPATISTVDASHGFRVWLSGRGKP
jgi:hypothetical protein